MKKIFVLKHETMWEDLRFAKDKESNATLYYVYFILRRFLYACILVLGPAFRIHETLMFGCIIFLNIAYLSYVTSARPFDSKRMQKIEIMNESVNYLVSCLILNLGIIPAGETYYEFGL
jgi:hypothetical protein